MSSSNNDEIISKASPHTIKKFELIEKYVAAWAQILCLNDSCNGLVFIDCMSNSGVYHDDDGEIVYGTPVRVAKVLRDVAGRYWKKPIILYFNDIKADKIELLKENLPKDTGNFKIITSVGDGNELLREIGSKLSSTSHYHYLLVYDPYDATIDWGAILPFINNWGEVIINHMLSDSIRAVKQAKSEAAIEKYEKTYLAPIKELIPFGSDKDAYEKRIEAIIKALRRSGRKYYIAAYPFFNSKNAIVYNLIHCTGHIKGFNLYKKTAWQTFDGKSSTKDTHGNENQMMLDFSGEGQIKTTSDEYCYYVKDIAEYLQGKFKGRKDVNYSELWDLLDEHPVFPSDGFKRQITNELKKLGAKPSRSTITFSDGSYSL